MNLRKKTDDNPFDLTEDEIAVLKSSLTPKEVKEFIVRSYDNIGDRVTAFEKVAAAARAERLALQEIRRLRETRESITIDSGWRQRAAELERTNRALEADNEAARKQVAQLTASPAMAVHSYE